MSSSTGRVSSIRKPFHPHFNRVILLVLVLGSSACGRTTDLIRLPADTTVPDRIETPTVTPFSSLTPATKETASPAVEAMSAEAEQYLAEALDYIEANSVMGSEVEWISLRQDALALVKNAQTTVDTYPAIRFAIDQLGDHHSFFQDPAEAEQFGRGFVKSLGFAASYPSGVVMDVAPGSPAEKNGIRVGDVLELVNGEPFKQDERRPVLASIDQTAQTQITFRPQGQEQPVMVTLDPAEFVVEYMPEGSLLFDDIGYIKLPRLFGSTPVTENYAPVAQQLIQNLDEQVACGWIVDLRTNRGGNMWPMLAGVGPVLGEGDVGWFVTGNGYLGIWTYQDGQSLLDNRVMTDASPSYSLKKDMPPAAVLTSPLTGSSGEAIAVAFRGRPNTRSFGEPTAGVPTANSSTVLSDGAMISLTVAWDADRTGQIYKDRIPPDQPIQINWSVVGFEGDPVIRAATDWLHTQADCR